MRNLLTSELIARFHEQGFLVIRKIVDPQVCARMKSVALKQLEEAAEPLEFEADVGYQGAPASRDAFGGRTVRRLRGAFDRDECFHEWALATHLIDILHQLMDEKVCLTLAHHNCIMTKHPQFGTATGWHRDIRYWSFQKPDLISVWLALGPEDTDNGGLLFIPGSHRLKMKQEQMDEADFLRPDHAKNQVLFKLGRPLLLNPGDVALFHSGLFHAGGRNNTNQLKTSVVFAYHGESNAPIPGTKSAAAPDLLLE